MHPYPLERNKFQWPRKLDLMKVGKKFVLFVCLPYTFSTGRKTLFEELELGLKLYLNLKKKHFWIHVLIRSSVCLTFKIPVSHICVCTSRTRIFYMSKQDASLHSVVIMLTQVFFSKTIGLNIHRRLDIYFASNQYFLVSMFFYHIKKVIIVIIHINFLLNFICAKTGILGLLLITQTL